MPNITYSHKTLNLVTPRKNEKSKKIFSFSNSTLEVLFIDTTNLILRDNKNEEITNEEITKIDV